jgi:CRP-like cAMP-binding protein
VPKDARALREEANAAHAAGKYKRALEAYLELERVEPRDAGWPKRAGETYRRLGKDREAIVAFERAADRYAQNGFLVQAIAVCKIVLQIEPNNADALRRLSQMNEQVGQGPTRTAALAENNPNLHDNTNVAAIRRANTQGELGAQRLFRTTSPPPIERPEHRTRHQTTQNPPLQTSRTKSKPITLVPGAALDSMKLHDEVPAYERDHSQPGVHVIPLEAEEIAELELNDLHEETLHTLRDSSPSVEIVREEQVEPEELAELELEDLEEIPLAEPRAIGIAAQRALKATPLFAGLPADTLEALVGNLQLISLVRGDFLFREGEPGDALYVVAEGELSMMAEGPPRVEMARLGPGSFIGEVALMTDQPRTATVVALDNSDLLRIDRLTLAKTLQNHGHVLHAVLRFVRDRLVDRWTRTSPLFRMMDDGQRAELAAKFRFLEIEHGTKLLQANARPDGLYIVLAGAFLVQRDGQNVATLGPGDLIGETALLSRALFRSDVVANGKSLALCLPAAEFREVIMTHPHILEYIGEAAEQSRRLQIL